MTLKYRDLKQFDAYEMVHDMGDGMGLHQHDYPHYLVVLDGVILVEIDGHKREVTAAATNVIEFPAGSLHGWRALVDNTKVVGVYPLNARPADTGELPYADELADLPKTGTAG